MAYSRLLYTVCIVYVCLIMRWFLKVTHSVDTNTELRLRGIDRSLEVAQIVRKENHTGPQFNVIVIGYGKHGKHTYPVQCDCNGDRYTLTNDTRDIRDANIVVFTVGARSNMSLDEWRRYHRQRKAEQVWVLGTRESPQTCLTLKPPNDMKMVYNWSFTYHSRADFPTPYGWFESFRTPQFGAVNWFAKKSRLISWTSSHCPLAGNRYKRRNFVYTLRNHITISMYGICGDGRLDGADYGDVMASFKFALVLENSCCSEYITEKFWDALKIHKQVPVVYGATRDEYERIAPPNSFIFIQDFSSLEELAGYLMRVGSNEEEYNAYHGWRRFGVAEKQWRLEDRMYHCHSICRMSQKMGAVKKGGESIHFDEESDVFFGGCRDCQGEVDVVMGNALYHSSLV